MWLMRLLVQCTYADETESMTNDALPAEAEAPQNGMSIMRPNGRHTNAPPVESSSMSITSVTGNIDGTKISADV